MDYESWLASVPDEITADPLWRMEVYRLREEAESYDAPLTSLLRNPPMP